jgi:hypothetical protein
MRSSSEQRFSEIQRAFLGDPSDPNYAYRLNTYNLERMAQAHRAMVLGELLANAILWIARAPGQLAAMVRTALLRRRVERAVAGWRS